MAIMVVYELLVRLFINYYFNVTDELSNIYLNCIAKFNLNYVM